MGGVHVPMYLVMARRENTGAFTLVDLNITQPTIVCSQLEAEL